MGTSGAYVICTWQQSNDEIVFATIELYVKRSTVKKYEYFLLGLKVGCYFNFCWVFSSSSCKLISLFITLCSMTQPRTGSSAFQPFATIQVEWRTRHTVAVVSVKFYHFNALELLPCAWMVSVLPVQKRWRSSVWWTQHDSLCRTSWVKWIMWLFEMLFWGKHNDKSKHFFSADASLLGCVPDTRENNTILFYCLSSVRETRSRC